MNGAQFLRALRSYCRANKLPAPVVNTRRGKGAHQTVFVGAKFTVVKTSEIQTGLHRAMLDQLGLPKDAF